MVNVHKNIPITPKAAYIARIGDRGLICGWPNGFFHVHWVKQSDFKRLGVYEVDKVSSLLKGSGTRLTVWHDLGNIGSLDRHQTLDRSIVNFLEGTKLSNDFFRDIDQCLAILKRDTRFGSKPLYYNPLVKKEISRNNLLTYFHYDSLKTALLASFWIIEGPLTNNRIKNAIGTRSLLEKSIKNKSAEQAVAGKIGKLNQEGFLSKSSGKWFLTQKGIEEFSLNSLTPEDRQTCIDRAWRLHEDGFTKDIASNVLSNSVPHCKTELEKHPLEVI